MKTKFLIAALAAISLFGCKKSVTSAPFQVQVSGLTSITLITFSVKNQNSVTILTETNVNNGNYNSFINVNVGDKLTITCTANLNDNIAGDGDGTLKYYFNGEQMGLMGE
jgi:hypothetical protein